MKHKFLILSLILIGTVFASVAMSQSFNWNFLTLNANNDIQPIDDSIGLAVPHLVGGANVCASIDAGGIFATTSCNGTGTGAYFDLSGTALSPTSTAYSLGIGTTTPTYQLETVGTSTAGFFGVSQNSAGDVMSIDNSGITKVQDLEYICPSGYIWVPGSGKYGTLPGFCVMKYEARSNAGVPYSTDPTVVPWVSISQETSRAECLSLGEGYHLISEAEWLTIAENIAVTEINDIDTTAGLQLATGMTDDESWYESNATMAVTSTVAADPVTTGCDLDLSLEHADNAYATSSCEVRGDNANGNYSDAAKGFQATDQAWDGTYTSGGSNDAQLRTHVLSNGNVIWDLSGNVWEWVDELLNEQDNPTDGSEAGDGSAEWEDWNTTYNLIGPIANSRPPDDGWTSSNGIGRIYTWGQDETGTTLYALIRGGVWADTSDAGVFTLNLYGTPAGASASIGFRCVR